MQAGRRKTGKYSYNSNSRLGAIAMLFKVNFNRALALSLFWHLLCFFMVAIIIVPVGISQNKLSEIYFLGSLLDRGSIEYEFKSQDGFSRRDRRVLIVKTFQGKDIKGLHLAPFEKENDTMIKKMYYDFRKVSSIRTGKVTPRTENSSLYEGPFIEISVPEGKSTQREIIFRPLLSEFKAVVIEAQKNNNLSSYYDVDISALIKSDGIVESARIIKTSGVADIDIIVIDYVKKCKFKSLEADGIQESAISIKVSF